jgi:hypothetical protein
MKVNSPAIHRGVLLFKRRSPVWDERFYIVYLSSHTGLRNFPTIVPAINRGAINFVHFGTFESLNQNIFPARFPSYF